MRKMFDYPNCFKKQNVWFYLLEENILIFMRRSFIYLIKLCTLHKKERGYIVKNTANLQLTKWVKMEYTLCGVKKV